MSSFRKPKTINPDEVDASVYYYDEVYDDMKKDEESSSTDPSNTRSEKVAKKGESRYIKGLQETAEIRKTEQELRKFKKHAKDRHEAKEDVSESDVYITSAYKKKLEDMRQLEEEKRLRLAQEKDNSMNFVKKFKGERQTKLSEISSDKSIVATTSTTTPSSSSTKTVESHKDKEVLVGPELRPEKRKLKTLEDRRNYLRKFLAKRTVGEVYKAAVRRYKERKVTQDQILKD